MQERDFGVAVRARPWPLQQPALFVFNMNLGELTRQALALDQPPPLTATRPAVRRCLYVGHASPRSTAPAPLYEGPAQANAPAPTAAAAQRRLAATVPCDGAPCFVARARGWTRRHRGAHVGHVCSTSKVGNPSGWAWATTAVERRSDGASQENRRADDNLSPSGSRMACQRMDE